MWKRAGEGQRPTTPQSTHHYHRPPVYHHQLMGRGRDRGGELKLHQSSLWACVLPQTLAPSAPASCCHHQSMGLFGFSTSPHLTHGSEELSPSHAAHPPARGRRGERKRGRATAGQAGARNFPPPPPPPSPPRLPPLFLVSFLGPISSPAPPFPHRFLLPYPLVLAPCAPFLGCLR